MRAKSFVFKVLAALLGGLSVVAGCDTSIDFDNKPPARPTITRTNCYIGVGGDVVLCATSVDPDGDPVTYRWTGADGEFDPSSGEGACVTWTAPPEPGTYSVTVTATDRIEDKSNNIVIEVGAELFIYPGVTELVNNVPFYVVDAAQPLMVSYGSTLRIGSGVTLVFNQPTSGLNIEGTIEINGTEEEPVVFKPNACPGDDAAWKGIVFEGDDARGDVCHANIRMAANGIEARDGAIVSIDSCFIYYGAGRGVYILDSTVYINGGRIWDNGGGVQIVDSYVRVEGTSISYNSSYGILLQENYEQGDIAFDVEITGCTIASNSEEGILLSFYAMPVINYNSILVGGNISGNVYAVKMYQYYRESTKVDLRYNYWGNEYTLEEDISGIIFDGLDYGQPDKTVDFSEWLMSQP